MSTVRLCKACGAPLPGDAPEGLCPACLLKRGLDQAATVTTASAQPEPRASALERRTPNGISDRAAGAPIENPKSKITNPQVRYFGDYELLEEIARGGMGVVYKARQVSLNRTVAVKMILAGNLAGEAEVKRFHTEAEAAANLQHPNIVAIHEVGVHEGLHYFSMDYVDGKNLAQAVKDGPLPPVRAAQLVKTIAEAIQYAHLRGVLHRDLKPQNVMLDSADRPRVTDFGLAKRLVVPPSGSPGLPEPAKAGTTNELTMSGAVMGSPSYMSPEQAQGKQDLVGPPSDVYSLGAILYELLTGRAPFRAETPLLTLSQVMEAPPTVPSKLSPGTPPDLEVICLKCLEKRPERRYASARALAEELGRFLNHEPILARPASPARKAWGWLQRNPWALAGLVSLALVGTLGLAYGLWQENRLLAWKSSHAGRGDKPPFDWEARSELIVGVYNAWFFVWLFCMVRLDRRTSKGLALRGAHWWIYAALGLLQTVSGFASVLMAIQVMVWSNTGDSWPAPALLPIAISPLWLGILMLWRIIGEHESATFGLAARGSGEELVLFSEVSRSRGLLSVGWQALAKWWASTKSALPVLLRHVLVVILAGHALIRISEERTAFYCALIILWCCLGILRSYMTMRKGIARYFVLWIMILSGDLFGMLLWAGGRRWIIAVTVTLMAQVFVEFGFRKVHRLLRVHPFLPPGVP